MADGEREHRFKQVWTQELNEVFADMAKYYDTLVSQLRLSL